MTAQRVAVAGSSGLIGSALCAFLRERGTHVTTLVRRAPRSHDEVAWDPNAGRLAQSALAGCDAVVNLAGAGIGSRRWSASYKRELVRSRVETTRTIGAALLGLHERGHTVRWVNGSAVGYYGDRGDEVLTESSAPGQDFLAGLCLQWEGATEAASQAGVPVALARTGIVMAPGNGAFRPLLLLGRLGLGGPLGDGRQWMPWITLPDEVRALVHLLDHPEITGPVNLSAPDVARQREVAAQIGKQLHRPAVLPAPAFAMRALLGEMADAAALASQRALPERLLEEGFEYEHRTLPEAVRWLLES